jgi:hypothetical protein
MRLHRKYTVLTKWLKEKYRKFNIKGDDSHQGALNIMIKMKGFTDINENLCKLCRIGTQQDASKIVYFG